MTDEWKSMHMRQKIVQEFDALLKQSPDSLKKSGVELESSLFSRASKKEDYLQNVSKIIMFLKDRAPQNSGQTNSNLTAMLTGQSTNSSMANNVNMNQGQGMAPNQMSMSSSMGQTQPTNTNQPQMMSGAGGSPAMGHGNTSGGQVIHSGGPPGMGPGQIRMSQGGINTLSQAEMVNWQQQHQQPAKGGRRSQSDMIRMGMNKQQHMGMVGMPGAMQQMAGMQGKMPPGMGMSPDPSMNPMVVGQHVPRAMQPRIPSPVYSGPGGPSPNLIRGPGSNQPGLPPSPMQQHGGGGPMPFIAPSPSGPTPSPGRGMGGGPVGQMNVPSPQGMGMIHTPQSQSQQQQQSPMQPSPMNPDDRAYLDKVRQLQSKYLNRLRTVAKKMGNNDNEQSRKVRSLLEMLENPQKRATMELLKKLEPVYEKIDSQQRETESAGSKDNPVSVLFESINFALKSPNGMHTIYRSLAPALNTLNGPDLDEQVGMKRKRSPSPQPASQESPAINDGIQGEVARLPSRFKVTLECAQGPGRDDITLNCQLDDPNLPCVPPITVTLPPDYPACPPQTLVAHYNYSSTTFLQKVHQIMKERQLHLPEVCSLTMMLDMWEMSVRQACSKNSLSLATLTSLIGASIA